MRKEIEADVIVIGGGPAGLMAAGFAAMGGARVIVLEKNKVIGAKLSITGGGRCNITNAEFDVRKFLDNFPKEKEFLFSPFAQFSAKDTFNFFEALKLPLVTEARNRVFPASQKAEDVVRTMQTFATKNGAEIHFQESADEFIQESDRVTALRTKSGKIFRGKYFVVAAGGVAAPSTGSTGDGFNLLQKLGHTIHQPNPHIVPLTTDASWVHALSGTTWSFMAIRFLQNGETIIKKTGKILFTHFGVSGPLILNCAHDVANMLAYGAVEASINLFPDTDEKALDERLVKLFDGNKNKKLKNVLPEIIHGELANTIISLVEPRLADVSVHEISKESRKQLIKTMQNLRFPISGTRGLEHATIADGGVDLHEVDTKTMRSRIHENIYMVGDTLHINRPSGGFSLQLCWTTGAVAGRDIANRCVN